MSLVVTPLELPERWDEPGPRGDAFRAFHAHAERSNAMRFGPDVVARSPEERLASLQPSLAEACRAFVAHRDGQLVGALKVYTPLLESTDVAEIVISAEPDLPDAEVLDLVEELTTHGEQVAAGLGRGDFRGGSLAAASGAVTAATGFGGADPHHPEVAPLVARGYVLEQVYRISMVDLAALPDLDERLAAARAGAPGYDVVAWAGETPAPHRAGMCRLKEQMAADAPGGGVLFEPEVWDDARLADFEASAASGGRTLRTVAAVERATGELVGFTSAFVGTSTVVNQHDTVVAGAHRGHGLGALMKLANLAELREHHPDHTRVVTWNAEENRPMLAVNEATGFVTVVHDGVWKRRSVS